MNKFVLDLLGLAAVGGIIEAARLGRKHFDLARQRNVREWEQLELMMSTPLWEECPDCGGTGGGPIPGTDEYMECPNCDGEGMVPHGHVYDAEDDKDDDDNGEADAPTG